jgi:energy-coupling factor transporter ATP-binding protein EcfA2
MHMMGMTIMVATHDIDFACEWAERVLILQNGSVFADGPIDLLFDEQVLAGAKLPLPRLVQPFRILGEEAAGINPRSVRETAQWIWRLMMRRQTNGQPNNKEEHG